MSEPLFETNVVNTDGVDGIAYVDREDGLRVVTSNPTSSKPGTNPEELFGLAMTTCLNATIKALLKAHKKRNQSKVTSKIALHREADGIGYYFDVQLFAAIEGLTVEEASVIVEKAEKRCPVAKLTQGATTLTVTTIAYE